MNKLKKELYKIKEKIEDNTLYEIKKEINNYQRPEIVSGKVTEACNTLDMWEKGMACKVNDWIKMKKRELGEPDGTLAYSVGQGLLSRMYEDTAKYLKSFLG